MVIKKSIFLLFKQINLYIIPSFIKEHNMFNKFSIDKSQHISVAIMTRYNDMKRCNNCCKIMAYCFLDWK